MRRIGPAELAALPGRLDRRGLPARPLVVVDLDHPEWGDWSDGAALAARLGAGPTPVLVGVATRALPAAAAPLLDVLSTTLAPAGPGNRTVVGEPGDLALIRGTVDAAPIAALTLARLLPLTARSRPDDGLVAESLAYSTLLAGPEFAAWRARTPRRTVPPAEDPVLLERIHTAPRDRLLVTLNRPERHNAFGSAVRDGLLDALAVAAADPGIGEVVLRGNGRSFCSGGDLDEFGTTPDVATAHLIRIERSAALAVHHLRSRVRVSLHGACIGAGIEVASFAGTIEAADDTAIQLPELSMGLIPGAGGTVGLPLRIGRWRTAYLALTGRRIDVATALSWGLVDRRA